MPDDAIATAGAATGDAGSAPAQQTQTGTTNPAVAGQAAAPTTATPPTNGQAASRAGEPAAAADDGIAAEPTQDAQPSAAPAEYDLGAVQMPEGYELDNETATAFAAVAKKYGISQEAFAGIMQEMTPVLDARQDAQLNDLRREFINQARNDPEYGGAKWAASKKIAQEALYKFSDPETRALLRGSGLDSHPGFIRMCYRIGKAMSDDTVVRGGAAAQRDPAKAFFYNSQMN